MLLQKQKITQKKFLERDNDSANFITHLSERKFYAYHITSQIALWVDLHRFGYFELKVC